MNFGDSAWRCKCVMSITRLRIVQEIGLHQRLPYRTLLSEVDVIQSLRKIRVAPEAFDFRTTRLSN